MTTAPEEPLKGFVQRGNKWWTRVPGGGGREVGWHDRDQLAAWKEKYKEAVKAGTALPPPPGTCYTPPKLVSFAEYARERWWPEYARNGYLDETFERTRNQFDQLLEFPWARTPIVGLTAEELRAWSDDLDLAVKPFRAARLRWLAKDVLKMAADDPHVPVRGNVAANLAPKQSSGDRRRRKKSGRNTLDLESIRMIVTRISAQFWIAVWLQLLAGLRVGEAFGAAVGSYRPATKDGPGYLAVERQYSDVPANIDEYGGQSRFRPWLKTRAGDRVIPLSAALDAAIRATIIRNYGRDVDDPWWDQPIDDPWDPALVLNRDLPIVVSPGPADTAYRISLYRKQLLRVAGLVGIDLRKSKKSKRGPLAPHDLRKAFSTRMLDAEAPREGRSIYLGHEHPAAWDEAQVTADVYSPETRERLVKVARLVDQHLVPWCGNLSPAPPATGDELLLTQTDAWEALDRPFRYELFRSYLRRNQVPTHPNPWHRTPWANYYRLGDVRDMISSVTGDNVVFIADVRHRLFPDADEASANKRIYREVGFGNLTRVRKSYYSRASVEHLEARFSQIQAGLLIPARGGVPRTAATDADHEVQIFECSKGAFVDARAVQTGLERSVSHHAAAAALEVDEVTYWAMLRQLDVPAARQIALAAEVDISVETLRKLTENRDELLAAAVRPTLTAPGDADWIPVTNAAAQLGVPLTRLDALILQLGWSVLLREGTICVRQSDVHDVLDRYDAVTIDELAERLGLDVDQVATLAKRFRWWTANERACSLDAVRATLTELTSGAKPDLLTLPAAAEIIGVSGNTVRLRVGRGVLPKAMCPIRSLVVGGASRARRMLLLWRHDVEAQRFVVPDGYMLLEQAAQEAGVELRRVREWVRDANPHALRDPVSNRVYVNLNDLRRWAFNPPPEGWLTVDQVVARTQFDTSEYRDMLRRRARRGYIDGVRAGAGKLWHFPPHYREHLPELLAPGAIGQQRTPRAA